MAWSKKDVSRANVTVDKGPLSQASRAPSSLASQKRRLGGLTVPEFWQRLEKVRADGFITEEVYRVIQFYGRLGGPARLLMDYTNVVLGKREYNKCIRQLQRTSTANILNKESGQWAVSLAVAYLLWTDDMLQVAFNTKLTVDEAAKAGLQYTRKPSRLSPFGGSRSGNSSNLLVVRIEKADCVRWPAALCSILFYDRITVNETSSR
ncbi:hypothetical protein RvY_18145 [Ramazzottius varieornatus]|uniref:Uncharacterized protein n=1 Tax=Ramazzottius varieornatus TaxID=947166 RepID=A0A1D1W4P6_RAMVA|nr:hypothetical protein RvY_18145 [Ramazzottius varieornatus]